MSNGDDADDVEDAADETGADSDAAADAETSDDPVATLEARLDDAAERLAAADTEADLDDVEATLEDIEADLESADLPEPETADEEDEDEEAADPREDLESRLETLREDLEAQRGPYAEDVVETLESQRETLTNTEWTDDGLREATDAVDDFLATADDQVGVDAAAGERAESAAHALGVVIETVENADLDPDEDADAIAALLEGAETLSEDLDAAETWDDLSVREQLDARGFYDVLGSEGRKDFPPEWSALKLHAQAGNVEQMLFALEKLDDSDFFEEYVYDQLVHLGRDAQGAFDVIHQRAQKRNKIPVRILGKIGDERAAETLHDFIDGDGDPVLQKVTLRALGEIGSEDSAAPIAQRLVAEDPEVRSVAARALGLLGDTRAIEPLADVLADDESDTVRASAAWALRQIGTERALDVASEYTDDRAYLVQAEAEKAAAV